MITLTKRDWAEIYNALRDKINSPVVSGDHEWHGHLEAMLTSIGPDGERASVEGVDPNDEPLPIPSISECDSCEWRGTPPVSMEAIPNLFERIDPGGIVPSGECPMCHALCYPLDQGKEENA